MTLSSNNDINIPRINIPQTSLSARPQRSLLEKEVLDEGSNSDAFLVFFQPPEIPKDIETPKSVETPKKIEIPNIQTSDLGPPTPQRIQQKITQLAKALELTFNQAQQYYTDKTGAIYYPQLNGSFYVTGRKAKNGDPIQPLTVVLNQQTNQPQNQPERSQPLLHTMISRELKLTPNNNWTFTSTLHPNVTFYLQLDGSVWGSNRTTYRLGADNSLIQQRNSEPLPFTTAIPQLGLYPLRLDNPTNVQTGIVQGAFMKTGDPGMYIPQPDGTIFYTGRINPKTERDPGGPVGPYVYRRGVNGVWSIDKSDTRRVSMSGSLALSSIKAYQDANGNWFAPSNDSNLQPYNVLVLSDNKVVKFRNNTTGLQPSVFNPTNNTWTNVTNYRSDPVLGKALDLFLAGSKLDTCNCKTRFSDGTWEYRGSDLAHGDSVYVLPNGRLLMLARDSSNTGVWTHDGTGWTKIGNRTSDATNPYPSDADISAGVQTVLQSRATRGWTNPGTRSANLSNYGDGTLRYAGNEAPPYSRRMHGDSMYVMSNGDLITVDPLNGRVFRHNGTRWSATGDRLDLDYDSGYTKIPTGFAAELKPAITAILASRERRNWRTPDFILNSMQATHNSDGTFTVGITETHRANKSYQSLSHLTNSATVYVLDNGQILSVSSDGKVHITALKEEEHRGKKIRIGITEYDRLYPKDYITTTYASVNDNAIPANIRESVRRGAAAIQARR